MSAVRREKIFVPVLPNKAFMSIQRTFLFILFISTLCCPLKAEILDFYQKLFSMDSYLDKTIPAESPTILFTV